MQDPNLKFYADTCEFRSHYERLLSARKKKRLHSKRVRCSKRISVPFPHHARKSPKKRRSPNNDVDKNGTPRKIDPKKTYWYRNYVVYPNISCRRFQQKFRFRFRLPHESFTFLLARLSRSEDFCRWTSEKPLRNKDERSPISLLLLGTLRYLGRGWTFDDLEEATGISEEVHRNFFHAFVKFGREKLYPEYVKFPTNKEEAKTHSHEFNLAGMHGAIGSMDACHVILEKCSHRLKQNHLGGKSKHTCRSYNLTCNHRRQILHTTSGYPARWNDKTIVLFDTFAKGLKNGTIMNDNVFELMERSENDEIIKVKYRGAWLVVDNGYLNWGVTIAPIKKTMYITETRWSEWMESMRKDVECTFGILKGRFRILKAGIRFHGVEITDNIWMTCCALHNLLLEVDGVTGQWDGDNGCFDFENESERLPFALQRLRNPSDQRNYDTSGMGPGVGNGEEDSQVIPNDCNRPIFDEVFPEVINEVNLLSAEIFRKKLVEHFDILFKQYQIQWSRRSTGNNRPII